MPIVLPPFKIINKILHVKIVLIRSMVVQEVMKSNTWIYMWVNVNNIGNNIGYIHSN